MGEDLLFFKGLKAKYFPNCTFLEAQPSQAASRAWQIFLASKEVVEKDWKLQVANGVQIKV